MGRLSLTFGLLFICALTSVNAESEGQTSKRVWRYRHLVTKESDSQVSDPNLVNRLIRWGVPSAVALCLVALAASFGEWSPSQTLTTTGVLVPVQTNTFTLTAINSEPDIKGASREQSLNGTFCPLKYPTPGLQNQADAHVKKATNYSLDIIGRSVSVSSSLHTTPSAGLVTVVDGKSDTRGQPLNGTFCPIEADAYVKRVYPESSVSGSFSHPNKSWVDLNPLVFNEAEDSRFSVEEGQIFLLPDLDEISAHLEKAAEAVRDEKVSGHLPPVKYSDDSQDIKFSDGKLSLNPSLLLEALSEELPKVKALFGCTLADSQCSVAMGVENFRELEDPQGRVHLEPRILVFNAGTMMRSILNAVHKDPHENVAPVLRLGSVSHHDSTVHVAVFELLRDRDGTPPRHLSLNYLRDISRAFLHLHSINVEVGTSGLFHDVSLENDNFQLIPRLPDDSVLDLKSEGTLESRFSMIREFWGRVPISNAEEVIRQMVSQVAERCRELSIPASDVLNKSWKAGAPSRPLSISYYLGYRQTTTPLSTDVYTLKFVLEAISVAADALIRDGTLRIVAEDFKSGFRWISSKSRIDGGPYFRLDLA